LKKIDRRFPRILAGSTVADGTTIGSPMGPHFADGTTLRRWDHTSPMGSPMGSRGAPFLGRGGPPPPPRRPCPVLPGRERLSSRDSIGLREPRRPVGVNPPSRLPNSISASGVAPRPSLNLNHLSAVLVTTF
jgi:hypothetical protein